VIVGLVSFCNVVYSLQMSAGSHIQMAPQSTINTSQPILNQDSNMSTGNY